MIFNEKKAAMEMSVGTIVTIVLLMTVLILGLVLVRNIYGSGSNAIDQIDSAIQNEMNKLFAEEGKTLVIYPTSRKVTLKKDAEPSGFAFSVKNNDVEDMDFTYTVEADPDFDFTRCGSSFTPDKANRWLLIDAGSFTLGRGNSLELAELVLFEIPESAPPCTVPFRLDIEGGGSPYVGAKFFITIK